MRCGKRRDLPDKRPQLCRQKEQAQHKQNMVQPFGQDVVKTHRNIGGKGLPCRLLPSALKQDLWAFCAALKVAGIGGLDPLLAQHEGTRTIRP